MEERLPLYENGVSAGILLRQEEGLHTLFSAECVQGQGMRKLWLRSERGGGLLLGTLVPEEGRWRLRKRVSRSELQRQGLTGQIWGELLSEGGPAAQSTPGSAGSPVSPRDPVIASAVRQSRGGRWRQMGQRRRLSYLWQVGQPVPLVPLFCFASVEGGELVFLLNEAGYPDLNE